MYIGWTRFPVGTGFLDLYEATSELRWLEEAHALDDMLAQHYEDTTRGGLLPNRRGPRIADHT